MANYSRNKIRIYPLTGTINPDDFTGKVAQLKEAEGIYETINIYYPANLKFGEIHFTLKRFPMHLDEIFDLKEYDHWLIHADEGGSPDSIEFTTGNASFFDSFHEKTLYGFDEIELLGNTSVISEKLDVLFGYGIRSINHTKTTNSITIPLSGLYTCCNFLYKSPGNILVEPIENIFDNTFAYAGEFREMIFNHNGIAFLENFYKPMQKDPVHINNFPYMESVIFKFRNKIVSKIDYSVSDQRWSRDANAKYWHHDAGDGFWNCENTKFRMYEMLK